MKNIKLLFFVVAVVMVLMNSYGHAAEEIASPSGIATRLTQNEAFISPFQVIVDQSGQLTVEPKQIFSEGAQSEFELPQLLTKPEPISLPSWMLTQEGKGEVILAVAVKLDGSVGEMMVMKSSGNETLDQWAAELVQKWQFRPAMKNGQAVYECIQIPIVFKLEPGE